MQPRADSEASSASDPNRKPNAIARGLGVLGDEWSLQVLRAAHAGATRFGQFQAELPISAASLASRLALLADEGLFSRRIYQTNPIRAEYILTPQGRGTWPILLGVWAWEDRWAEHPEGALPTRRHLDCGREFHPILVCDGCGGAVGRHDLRATWGPTGGWPRSLPTTATRRRTRTPRTAGEFPESMAIIGNRWSAVVMGAILHGLSRYSEIEAALTIPSNILSERLGILIDHGVLEVQTSGPGHREYRLTDKGTAFFPVVATALHWAERWYALPEGPAMTWQHRDHRLIPRLHCDQCLAPLAAAQIVLAHH